MSFAAGRGCVSVGIVLSSDSSGLAEGEAPGATGWRLPPPGAPGRRGQRALLLVRPSVTTGGEAVMLSAGPTQLALSLPS